MKVGVIGLGDMGGPIAKKLYKSNCQLTVYDKNQTIIQEFKNLGITVANNIEDLSSKSEVIWVMVPHSAIDNILNSLCNCTSKDTVIIDGGNSFFKDTIKRANKLKDLNITLLDCGTSGGLWGAEHGFSMTIGGDYKAFLKVKTVFKLLAYSSKAYCYVGPSGAGHYVKMVHNGIEYAIFESYSEGLHLLKDNNNYQKLNLEDIVNTWQNGAIIRSWTLHLIKKILQSKPNFKKISGVIGFNETGNWAQEESKKANIPVPVIKKAIQIRKETQKMGFGNFANKLVALIRNIMGGHPIQKCTSCKEKIQK